MVDALVAAFREAILAAEFTPGERVSEAEIARRFGVARPSVRAALQVLIQDGSLRREPNRSVYVPRLSGADVRDLFAVRTMVEIEAVRRLSAGAAPAGAVRALRALEALHEDDPWGDVVRADLAFHQALVDSVGSPRLTRIFATIRDEVRLSIAQLRPVYSSPTALAKEHAVLLGAISGRSVTAAVDAMRRHLEDSLAALTPPTAGADASRTPSGGTMP